MRNTAKKFWYLITRTKFSVYLENIILAVLAVGSALLATFSVIVH